MLALVYIVKYLSFAMKTTADGYRQIDDVLDEAARVSGAGWGKTMMTIWLPLMKAPMIAAWFLIFMPVVSELTMTVLLTGPGLETVGTVIFQLQEYADASGGGASVIAIMVVSMVILINWIVKKVSNGRYSL
jgi:iron(III) transport system permease protein